MITVKPLRNIPYWKALCFFLIIAGISGLAMFYLTQSMTGSFILAKIALLTSAVLTFMVLMGGFEKACEQELTGQPSSFSMNRVITIWAMLSLVSWLAFAHALDRESRLLALSLSFNVLFIVEVITAFVGRLFSREKVSKGLCEWLCAYRNR